MTIVDQTAYAAILSTKLPHVIGNDEEYERLLGEAESLIRRRSMSPAEEQFFDLLTLLIEKYEESRFALRKADPPAIIRELMAARSISRTKLAEVVGSKGNTSEILAGKREVSKAQARKLGVFFKVPAHLFLSL